MLKLSLYKVYHGPMSVEKNLMEQIYCKEFWTCLKSVSYKLDVTTIIEYKKLEKGKIITIKKEVKYNLGLIVEEVD